jgi:FOG: HEAT repeat
MWRSVSFLVVAASLAALSLAEAGDKAPDQTALADAREDVSQALLAETLGNNAERTKRLTKAWMAVPELAEANWHMARVHVADQWKPLAEVVSAAAQDPDQEQYSTLRDKAAGNPRALRDLARWCAKRQWHDRARLHYAQLLADPQADAAQKSDAVEKLNLVQVNGAWLTKEEVEARQEEAKAIQESLTKWRPKLKALQEIIDGADFAKRDRAIAELDKLDDPAMIPALESFLLDAKADFQEQAVKKLSSFRHFEATEALAQYSVLSESTVVRDAAIQALKERPIHEYCPLLLSGLVSPLKSRFSVRVLPRGEIQYVHAILREGPTANQFLLLNQVAHPKLVSNTIRKFDSSSPRSVSNFGDTPQEAAGRTFNEARTAVRRVESTIAVSNAMAANQNRLLFRALELTTGQALSHEPSAWWSWWQSQNEYYWPKPTQYAYSYHRFEYVIHQTSYRVNATSCFLAGTPVRTEMGIVPIESLKAGDRVLTQDQDSGELAYKVVLRTTLRPPAKMVEIKAGGENIYTTLGHPFWVAGQGWRMAKQLKEGDLLHGLGGATPIESIAAAGEHAAHNLVVDDTNTYFVGRAGLLVHDNEFRKPTRAIVPGLASE